MRTEQARPVRLDQYRPPDWLVETVELDVSLHPTATKVRATLKMSPNPRTAPAPIVLDGDGLTLASLKLDGQTMRPDGYIATPDSLTITQPPPGICYLQIETRIDPSANTQLMGLYRSNGSVNLEVQDRGIGIAAAEQDKIFDKFYRCGDPLVHNTKGSGLGLSLVRHIAQAHGGEVSVESVPDKGSKFIIALPIDSSAQERGLPA